MAQGQLGRVLRHFRRLVGAAELQALSDRQLLEKFAGAHDEAAFETLVRRHGALVRGVCRRVLQHEQDAEDAFQATFLILARKAAGRGWQDSVGPWLYSVAYRVSAKARAQRHRRL